MNRQAIIDSRDDNVAPSAPCPPERMQQRIARWGDIPASPRAFVDTYVKGHERTLYSVIGTGVSDDLRLKPKIAAAENLHADFIVAPKDCGAAMHRHDSEEFRSLDGDGPDHGGLLISVLGGRTPARVKRDASLADKARAIGAGFDANGMAIRAD